MYIALVIIIILLIMLSAIMYLRTSHILKNADKMLDEAIDGAFSEKEFSEARLSRLEAKMRRYLAAGKTSRNRLAEEHNSIKSLVSDISHQTKTPISSIMLYTDLLAEKASNAESAELLKNIRAQADKLNFLIQALVKTSRLENGIVAVAPAENSVTDLLRGMDFADIANEKGVAFKIAEVPDISAVFDLKWTSEALANIIDNAIKYTPAGGKVTVAAREYELFARVDVTDTGIGISEEETAKIFSRFYRSPRVHDESGVGIGLYLAREILSRQGGYIKVSSEKGGGSTFSVFLPKKQIKREVDESETYFDN